MGGAHREPRGAADALQRWIVTKIQELRAVPVDKLLEARYERFRKMGSYLEPAAETEAPAGR